VLEPMDERVKLLRLSPRGSWRAELESGARLELGRGDEAEVLARVERLARTLGEVSRRFGDASDRARALVAADLRHADGYALRLAGVATASGSNNK
jgi:cell division protein FtsQ